MMADAKECDICKKLYKPKEQQAGDLDLEVRMAQPKSGALYLHTIDLCPSCQLELDKWYKSRKEKFEK